jgi:Holliday junction resolvase-like predicted endonuclease
MAALLIYLVPAVAVVGLQAAGAPWAAIAGTVALSILAGMRLRRRAGAREYGKRLESSASARAVGALRAAGMTVEEGRMTRVGDVDLIVRFGQRTATVEIKSFWYWRGRLRDFGRQRKARAQARRQRKVVGADTAIIWLPNARANWLTRLLNRLWPERDPYVVMGSPQALARCTQRWLR